MNWLHCNKCGIVKDSTSNLSFFCGLCGHVLCSMCNGIEKCPVDNRPFNAVKVEKSMPENLRFYFEDPNHIQKTWNKCIRFQFEQRTLWETRVYQKNMDQIRQSKEKIRLLDKAKDSIQQKKNNEMKRIGKLQTYIKNYLRKQPEMSKSLSLNASTSTPMTSFDASIAHRESGVDLRFDVQNMSN